MRESQARTLALQIRSDGLGSDVQPVRINDEAPAGFGWGVSVDGASITSPAQLAHLRDGRLGEEDWRSVVRLPPTLADRLRRRAGDEGISINAALVQAVQMYLDPETR